MGFLNHYMMRLSVLFTEPFWIEDEEEKVRSGGYYRNFGVTAVSEEAAKALVIQSVFEDDLPGRVIDWADSEVEEWEIQDFEEWLKTKCKEPDEAGVWYLSGRAFWPEEAQE